MAKPPDYNDMLAIAAKQVLGPLGLKRKGKSRLWIDDRGLWLFVVEFQPHSWSKGSYLNVSASWLWSAFDHLSYDVFNRVGNFASVTEGQDFSPQAIQLAALAKAEITKLREKFVTLQNVFNHLESQKETFWTLYDLGVIRGWLGQLVDAGRAFQRLASLPAEHDWQKDLQARATRMVELLDDHAAFQAAIRQTVALARAREKLPALELA